MAYQQVGTPRFYINVLEWLASNMTLTGYSADIMTGADTPALFDNHFRTLPVNVEPETLNINSGKIRYDIPIGSLNEKTFFAILGISRTDSSSVIPISDGWGWISNSPDSFPIVNCTPSGGAWSMGCDGFAIGGFPGTDLPSIGMRLDGISEHGSIVIGTYYDMPHSPDMSLSLSYDYSGIKTIETLGGSTLSNSFYSKPPAWGSLGAWELHDPSADPPPTQLSRSGRKIWDLSFSYLDDGDVFGSNQSLSFDTLQNEISGVSFDDNDVTSNVFNYNLLSDDNFFSQVIHKTNGGQLPFIFQPNNNDKTNFAICKLDMKSFNFSQVANGVYNIKLKIREVW